MVKEKRAKTAEPKSNKKEVTNDDKKNKNKKRKIRSESNDTTDNESILKKREKKLSKNKAKKEKEKENEKNIQAIANHSKLDISSSLRSINDLHLKNNEKRLSQISSLNQSEIKSIEQNNPKKENTANKMFYKII